MATINISTQFSTTIKPGPQHNTSEPGLPMNILFSGDMGGTKHPASAINIDRDNFEDVMKQLDIQINLGTSASGESFIIPIKELDDFHPDNLYDSLEIFRRLRQLRRQLNKSTTFQTAATEIQGWLMDTPKANNAETTILDTDETPSDSSLLDTILISESRVSSSQQSDSLVEQLIKEVVRPYIIKAEDPNKESYIRAVDNALTDQMRAILHDTRFQKIESAWRDLFFLVRRLETGSKLKLFLIDAEKDAAQNKLKDILSHQPDYPWVIILGHYTFTPDTTDIETLTTLGDIGRQCNAPIIASAHSSFVGLETLSDDIGPEDWPTELDAKTEQNWANLRSSEAAHYICLSLPRFLSRYPYGRKSGPVNNFSFEELESQPEHEHYLWGNPATLLTHMIGQAYTKDGWLFKPNEQNRIGGFATHVYDEDGEHVMKPCAEINLSRRGAEAMTKKGLVPIFSVRNEDAIQIGKICSVARSRTLKGRWN